MAFVAPAEPAEPGVRSASTVASRSVRIAFPPSPNPQGVSWRRLISRYMLVLVWLPILAVTAMHYSASTQDYWIHDIARRLYYLPIMLACFHCGLRGGLAAAVVVTVGYLPHGFMSMQRPDPALGLEKGLEVVLWYVFAAVAGRLADLERQRRTELQRALAEQRRLMQQLARAGRLSALGEVVAGIAHELRNPLHALAGTAEIIDPLIPGDVEERRMWELHVAEIARLERVAERFLSFARPCPLELRSLDLRDVASRLVDLVGAEARGKQIELRLDLPAEPAMVLGDRDQLAQVALNIALNGLRAAASIGRPGKMLVVVAAREQDGKPGCQLRIENDGPAIAEEELEHLFDPFHSGADGGTGLGLSISARIADQHGGFLEAANAGLGVAFTLFLPQD